MHLFKPEGGTPGICGHLTSIAFPTLGNLTKNLSPRVGTFAFLARRNGTKVTVIVPCACLCADADFRFVNGDAIIRGGKW